MGIGGNLKHWRQVRGLTQPELAEKAGIEQSYLSKLENGRSQASEQVRERLAYALGVDAETLLKDPSENGRLRRAALAALSGLLLVAAGFGAGYLASDFEIRKVHREGQRLETVWTLAPAGVTVSGIELVEMEAIPHMARLQGSYKDAASVHEYASRLLDSGLLGTRLKELTVFDRAQQFEIVIAGVKRSPLDSQEE